MKGKDNLGTLWVIVFLGLALVALALANFPYTIGLALERLYTVFP